MELHRQQSVDLCASRYEQAATINITRYFDHAHTYPAQNRTVISRKKDMNCFIYRCSRKPDLYLYLAEKDDFSPVPVEIMRGLGIAEFSMELELTTDTKLAREDVARVMNNLEEKGFHLQLPGDTPVEAIMARLAKTRTR